jgi:hypothetical protein
LPSANNAEEQQIPNSIYRLGHSDLFGYKNCKIKSDKPFMMNHPLSTLPAGDQSKQNSEVIK